MVSGRYMTPRRFLAAAAVLLLPASRAWQLPPPESPCGQLAAFQTAPRHSADGADVPLPSEDAAPFEPSPRAAAGSSRRAVLMRPILATGIIGAHAVAPAVAAAGPTAGEAEELAAATTASAEDEIARVTSEAATATASPAPAPPPPPSSPPPSMPRLGRFEALRGALSFMAPREWVLGPSCAPSALRGAVLVFRRSGDVELREGGGGGAVIAEGASPWKCVRAAEFELRRITLFSVAVKHTHPRGDDATPAALLLARHTRHLCEVRAVDGRRPHARRDVHARRADGRGRRTRLRRDARPRRGRARRRRLHGPRRDRRARGGAHEACRPLRRHAAVRRDRASREEVCAREDTRGCAEAGY